MWVVSVFFGEEKTFHGTLCYIKSLLNFIKNLLLERSNFKFIGFKST